MQLYQFNLPRMTNDGKPYRAALEAWEAQALSRAGGLTIVATGYGQWKDGETVYRDRCVIYQIACDAEAFNWLLSDAFRLFADQLAIFTARIGEATIHAR